MVYQGSEPRAWSRDCKSGHASGRLDLFRISTGESPHQFLLRQRVEHDKEMLHEAEMRVLDVAVACGFKTQQHLHECCSARSAVPALRRTDTRFCAKSQRPSVPAVAGRYPTSRCGTEKRW